MSLFSSSCLVTGGISLLFGIFVAAQNPRSRLNLLWCLVSVSVALWSVGLGLLTSATEYRIAILWLRIHYTGAILIPVFFLHFALKLTNKEAKPILLTAYGLAAVFMILSFAGRLVDVTPKPAFNYYTTALSFYPVYVLFFFASVVYAHYVLIQQYRTAWGLKREQVKYLFIGSGVGFLGGSTAFFPVFDWPIFPYGMYLVALHTGIIGYSIVRYRLMNISVVIHKGLAYTLMLGLIFVPAFLAIMVNHRATPYSVPPLIAAGLILACGLWIVFENPRKTTNQTFAGICLAVSVWLFGIFMLYSARHEQDAIFWGKFAFIGVVLIPALFYHFCASFLKQDQRKGVIVSTYLTSGLFLSMLPTEYFNNGLYSYFWGAYPKAGPLHPLFLLYFASVSGVALRKLYVGYREKKETAPLEATRIQYVFWAFVIGYVASLDFVQQYGIRLYPTGYVFACLWVIIVSYAILKYQLLDVAQVTRTQFLPYVQAFALIPSYLVILGLIWMFTGTMQYILAGILLATFAVLAEVLVSIQKRMEKVVEYALFRKKYDAYETLTEFSKALVAILDLNDLNEKIIGTLARVMGIKKLSLFLLEKEKDYYYLAAGHGIDAEHLKDVKIRRFAQYLGDADRFILKEELERSVSDTVARKSILNTMTLIEAELCIPLRNKDRIIGFLNLGHNKNLDMYSQEDLNLLFTLAQNAAIALDNALLYEDLRKQKTLIRRTDRLRSLETIAGGFAHEIRNPLTSIKTFVQLAPQRKDDPQFVGEFSAVVCEDVSRIERLIQEILDYAKYMEPKFLEEDLNEVVSSCLYFVQVNAESKSVRIEKEFADDIPAVMLDRQQLKQVLLNLFMNALHAMGAEGGQLTVKTHALVKRDGAPWVQIEVSDTGSGIPAADLDHIFDPFYTTKHESEEREGTGLGLTIVHQIIQEHGGYIEVQSEVGRGTTFFVNLPVKPRKVQREGQEIKKPALITDKKTG